MEDIGRNLTKTVGKYFVLGAREEKELSSVVNNWAYETRQENTQRLEKALSMAKAKPSEEARGKRKLNDILPSIGKFKPKTVLDFGAGTGDVTQAAALYYSLSPTQVFAIEPKEMPPSSLFTYKKDISQVPDASIDLILILETLHHIHPQDRIPILSHVSRVLSPKGKVIIQEHAYNATPAHYIGLDIYHNVWYIKNKEDYDPLYLFSIENATLQMANAGLELESKTDPRGWQQIYSASFVKKIS